MKAVLSPQYIIIFFLFWIYVVWILFFPKISKTVFKMLKLNKISLNLNIKVPLLPKQLFYSSLFICEYLVVNWSVYCARTVKKKKKPYYYCLTVCKYIMFAGQCHCWATCLRTWWEPPPCSTSTLKTGPWWWLYMRRVSLFSIELNILLIISYTGKGPFSVLISTSHLFIFVVFLYFYFIILLSQNY